NLVDLELFLTCDTFRNETLQSVKDPAIVRFFRTRFPKLAQNAAYMGAILNKLSGFLGADATKHFLEGGVTGLRQILEKPGAIVLVSLASGEIGEVSSQLLGQMFLTALSRAAIRADKPIRSLKETNVFIDEIENFTGNEASRTQLLRFAEEGRRYGVGLHVAHQAVSQLDSRFRSVLRNVIGSHIYLALGGGDSDTVAGELPSEEPRIVLRNWLSSQAKGEGIFLETAKPMRRIKIRMPEVPPVEAAVVAQVRRSAMERWGTLATQIDAERERLECFYYGDASDEEEVSPAPQKSRTRSKVGQRPSADSGPKAGDIVGVEVLDNPSDNAKGDGS
uniref:hypothetical protein n=1 Tax=Armatimonas sp. TaxID=1872638 RepID=UPI003750BE6E